MRPPCSAQKMLRYLLGAMLFAHAPPPSGEPVTAAMKGIRAQWGAICPADASVDGWLPGGQALLSPMPCTLPVAHTCSDGHDAITPFESQLGRFNESSKAQQA